VWHTAGDGFFDEPRRIRVQPSAKQSLHLVLDDLRFDIQRRAA
jgi:hypothetical protein